MTNPSEPERRALKSSTDDENEHTEDVNLESYFGDMKDDDFTRAVDKLTMTKQNKKEAAEIKRLKKEASRHMQLTTEDKKLK